MVRKWIIRIGLATLIGNSILVYITWLKAFFGGGTVLVDINHFGEAGVEFFFFPITIFFAILTILFVFKNKKIIESVNYKCPICTETLKSVGLNGGRFYCPNCKIHYKVRNEKSRNIC